MKPRSQVNPGPADPRLIGDRYRENLWRRVDTFRVVVVFVLAVLMLRLYVLQFLINNRYAGRAQANVERKISTEPLRGRILDREGRLLSTNSGSYRLVMDRSWGGRGKDGVSSDQMRASVARVGELLDWSDSEVVESKELVTGLYRDWVNPNRLTRAGYVILTRQLTAEDAILLAEHHSTLPGLRLEETQQRQYPEGRLACHLLGYTGPITAEDYAARKHEGYRMTDQVGRCGVERAYDRELKGSAGISWQRRYATNIIESEVLSKSLPAQPGEDLFLTFDSQFQRFAEDLLGQQPGAIAAVDPRDGSIRALASAPGFDLALFQGGISSADYRRVLETPGKPLIDRSIGKGGSGYPPGSVFKIVTALAALEENLITPSTAFHCGGAIPVGNSRKRCWKRSGHGTLDFVGAFKRSCDVYFYHVGERLGIERLAAYSRELGLGAPAGLPPELAEGAGLIPDQAWKLLNSPYGRWGRGDTLNTAIGQGFVLVTPLQVALLVGAVATDGLVRKAQLLSHRRNAVGDLVWELTPESKNPDQHRFRPENLRLLQTALQAVVNERGGTGTRAQVDGLRIGGKTGTAEHTGRSSDAWFACYAPAENPELAVAVVLEGGGHGGETAAPLARELLEFYFRDRLPVAEVASLGEVE